MYARGFPLKIKCIKDFIDLFSWMCSMVRFNGSLFVSRYKKNERELKWNWRHDVENWDSNTWISVKYVIKKLKSTAWK